MASASGGDSSSSSASLSEVELVGYVESPARSSETQFPESSRERGSEPYLCNHILLSYSNIIVYSTEDTEEPSMTSREESSSLRLVRASESPLRVRFCHSYFCLYCILSCQLASVFVCSIVYLEYRLRHGVFV